MRLLVDECCQHQLIQQLRDAGHDVVAVVEVLPKAHDREIAAFATKDSRLLITEDYDFGEIAVRHGAVTHGVLLVDPSDTPLDERPRRVLAILSQDGESLGRRLTIVAGTRIRRRRLP